MISDKFVIFGALLGLYGAIGYARDVIKGNAMPNRVSWFMWALAPLIAFAAELNKGVGLRSLMTFMVGFIPVIVLAASFVSKKSIWKLGKFDFVCAGLSLLGLALWLATREGNIAILFSIMADGLASLPTLAKSFTHPQSESHIVYTMSAASAVITLLTIDHWTFANYGFPIYIFILCSTIAFLTKFKLGPKLLRTSAG